MTKVCKLCICKNFHSNLIFKISRKCEFFWHFLAKIYEVITLWYFWTYTFCQWKSWAWAAFQTRTIYNNYDWLKIITLSRIKNFISITYIYNFHTVLISMRYRLLLLHFTKTTFKVFVSHLCNMRFSAFLYRSEPQFLGDKTDLVACLTSREIWKKNILSAIPFWPGYF